MGCYGMGVNRIVAALSNQERPKKFKDSDLIGIPPLRMVVGDRGLKESKLEIK
jgi:prolyl-tRNA synthetase